MAPIVRNAQEYQRDYLNFYAVGAAVGATGVETAVTLTKAPGTGATSTGVSFTPTRGKRFRITSLVFLIKGNAVATAADAAFSLRVNAAGAVTTGSTPLVLQAKAAVDAVAGKVDRVVVQIPETGYEIPGDGTLQFGLTVNAVYVTNAPTVDVLLTGYEY